MIIVEKHPKSKLQDLANSKYLHSYQGSSHWKSSNLYNSKI